MAGGDPGERLLKINEREIKTYHNIHFIIYIFNNLSFIPSVPFTLIPSGLVSLAPVRFGLCPTLNHSLRRVSETNPE